MLSCCLCKSSDLSSTQ